MTSESWYGDAVDGLLEELRRSSDRSEASCGEGGATEVEVAGEAGGEPAPPTEVVTFRREGCEKTLLVRVFEPEYRLEIQTVPQTATHAVQAKRHGAAVEWVWGGRPFGTTELAAEIVRVWQAS